MPDEALAGIDDALTRASRKLRPDPKATGANVRPADPLPVPPQADEEVDGPTHLLDNPVWPLVFFGIQFLWGIPLFFPNAQGIRFLVRALPYVSSLVFLVLFLTRSTRNLTPRGTVPLVAALLLLVLNLVNPMSQVYAGIAQCIFQLSIAAPMFWMHKAVRSPRQLELLVGVILVMNFASAAMGVLQVYYPDQYMPPQFSAQLTDDMVESMSYLGSDGRIIMRPPGLSDTPGGAAIAGGLTVVLGLGICLYTRKLWQTIAATGMGAVGLAAVYLTQVRSVFLMAIGALAIVVVIALRQRRLARAGWGIAIGGTIIVASFLWAASIGGDSVSDRFLSIGEQGAYSTYQENRGSFLANTVGDMLDEYPFGAGVGRWGMMQAYFGDPLAAGGPIYVEIQLTGWLLDGGLPMWLLYGSALLLAVVGIFEIATGPNQFLREIAPLVLAVQVFIIGMSLSGPTFNMQLGILFWALTSAVYGAARGTSDYTPAR